MRSARWRRAVEPRYRSGRISSANRRPRSCRRRRRSSMKRWRGACSRLDARPTRLRTDTRTRATRYCVRCTSSSTASRPSGRRLQSARPNGPPRLSRGHSDADPLAELRPRDHRHAWPARHDLHDAAQQREPCGAPGAKRDGSPRQPRRPDCQLASRVHAFGAQPGAGRAEGLVDSSDRSRDAAPGCYSGLLVVRGVDYLRALITIEVE